MLKNQQTRTGPTVEGRKRVRSIRAWPIIWHLVHSLPLSWCGARCVSVLCVTKICSQLAAVVKRGALKNTQQCWAPATVYRQIWGWWVVFWRDCSWLSATHSLLWKYKKSKSLRNEHRLEICLLEEWLIGGYGPTLPTGETGVWVLRKTHFSLYFNVQIKWEFK